MISILTKIFIKNSRDLKNPQVRRSYGMLTTAVGIVLNILLSAGKFITGALSGAVSITADGFNNLTDAVSAGVMLAGYRISGAKADKKHPFGYGRTEYVAGFLMAAAIIVVAVELIQESVRKIIRSSGLETGPAVFAVLLVSVAVKLYMGCYNLSISRKINSTAMKATAKDSFSDAAATGGVLVSMAVFSITGVNIDGITGVLVGIFIMISGLSAFRDAADLLIGEKPDEELVKQVEQVAREDENVMGVHDITVHNYGPGQSTVTLHVELPSDMAFSEAHSAADRIERAIKEKTGCEAVVHMDPVDVNNHMLHQLKRQLKIFLKTIDRNITFHDLQIIRNDDEGVISLDLVIPYDFSGNDNEVMQEVLKMLHYTFPDFAAAVKIDKK